MIGSSFLTSKLQGKMIMSIVSIACEESEQEHAFLLGKTRRKL
jgi:hypothetical protein